MKKWNVKKAAVCMFAWCKNFLWKYLINTVSKSKFDLHKDRLGRNDSKRKKHRSGKTFLISEIMKHCQLLITFYLSHYERTGTKNLWKKNFVFWFLMLQYVMCRDDTRNMYTNLNIMSGFINQYLSPKLNSGDYVTRETLTIWDHQLI